VRDNRQAGFKFGRPQQTDNIALKTSR